jgi:hypothetical protein
MPKIRTLLLSFAAFLLLSGAAGAGPALASHSQLNYFEASSDLIEPSTRARTIAQLQALGVRSLRIELAWGAVAPGPASARRPSFDATNPGNYAWGAFDSLLAEAKALRWHVLLTVTGPAPRWATSNKKAPYVTRPGAKDFREFMTAVARHYGSQVQAFSIWNEPNHPAFLLPQWNSNGTPASPRIYRGLYQAGYEGLQAGGIAHPRVLFGETAPTGYVNVKSLIRRERGRALLHDVAPLVFLRAALCLNEHYRRAGSCGKLQMSGYAHHAYTIAVRPTYVPPKKDDVMIGALSRLSRALNLAAAAHAIPGGVPIYLTEFGVQSKPNRQLGVSVAKQAEYDAIAEHIAWSNGRVAAFSQYLLRDDPLGGAPGASTRGGTVGFQTGLEYASGSRKPLYFAWPVPLTVSRSRHGSSLWGLIRPATGATQLTLLVRSGKRYKPFRKVRTNGAGYWALNTSKRAAAWRVQWVSPAGLKYEGPPIAG